MHCCSSRPPAHLAAHRLYSIAFIYISTASAAKLDATIRATIQQQVATEACRLHSFPHARYVHLSSIARTAGADLRRAS